MSKFVIDSIQPIYSFIKVIKLENLETKEIIYKYVSNSLEVNEGDIVLLENNIINVLDDETKQRREVLNNKFQRLINKSKVN